jgi:hypothetical protein
MIKEYINKLIENLPNENKVEGRINNIDLILDGGIFNGSYLFGSLYFLKELENKKYIKVNRISSCSIGSIAGLLYFIDQLDESLEMYNMILDNFKKKFNLNIFDMIFNKIKTSIPSNFCKKIKNKFYISYYDMQNREKIVKSKYKNIEDLFETIRKSCFVPFIVNGNMFYKNRYLDGINPYIFNVEKKKQILYLDLFGSDKIPHLLCVKNEKNNFHRILSGLLDIHLFYIKNNNTQMCSYVNNWGIFDIFHHRVKKYIIECFIFYVSYLCFLLKRYIPEELYDGVIFKIIMRATKDVYINIIKYYCF